MTKPLSPTTTAPVGNTRTASPPPTVDVAAIDPKSAEFRALPAAHQTAVREAQAYAAAQFRGMDPAPRILVTSSAGNGSAPVTVIVPPGARDPLRVHTHYHGDRAGSVRGENAAADTIAAKIKGGDKTVYVLPEARSPHGQTDWSNVSDIDRTTADALTAAGLGRASVDHRTVTAHSAGGRAIAAGVAKGKDLTADVLILQDALYDGARQDLARDLPRAVGVGRVVVVPSADNPSSVPRGEELKRQLAKSWTEVDLTPPAANHPAAAAVLQAPPRRPAIRVDTFER